MPTKAAIYTRISQDRQGLEAGVQRQEEDCRKLIAERGWELAGIWSDNDISASRYSRKRRNSYHEMLAEVVAGNVGAVVAYHPKRLVRQMVELEDLIALVENTGVRFEFVQLDMPLDLNTASGRAMARIAAAFGAMESEEQSERIRRVRLQEARQGLRPTGGGVRPFGYETGGMKLRPAEAEAIREAINDVLAGASTYSIARRWNEAGLLTPRGNRWQTSTVTAFLRQASLAGLRVHRRTGEVNEGAWPAIISIDEHELLKRRLQPTGQKAGKRRGLLSGIVRCALCDRPLAYSRDTPTRYRYRCDQSRNGGCGQVRVAQGHALEVEVVHLSQERYRERVMADAAELEPEIRRLEKVLGGPLRFDGSPLDEAPEITSAREIAIQQLRDLEDRDTELADMLGSGELRRADYNRLHQRITEEREQLEAELRTANAAAPPSAQLLEAVFEWSLGRRELTIGEADALRTTIKSNLPNGVVYVKPDERFAREFQASRLEVRE